MFAGATKNISFTFHIRICSNMNSNFTTSLEYKNRISHYVASHSPSFRILHLVCFFFLLLYHLFQKVAFSRYAIFCCTTVTISFLQCWERAGSCSTKYNQLFHLPRSTTSQTSSSEKEYVQTGILKRNLEIQCFMLRFQPS